MSFPISPGSFTGRPITPGVPQHTGTQQPAQSLGGMTARSGLPLAWPPLDDPQQDAFSQLLGSTPLQFSPLSQTYPQPDLLPTVPPGYFCSQQPWPAQLQQPQPAFAFPQPLYGLPAQPTQPASSCASKSSSSSFTSQAHYASTKIRRVAA